MSPRGRTLPRAFYDRDALAVAPELLGKVLVVDDPEGGRLAARLVEVEAYRGGDDPGAHSYRGRTPRNATMFGPPGRLYVYFSYGMHHCVNAVCGPGTEPHAVLLRAAAPLRGLEAMRARRPAARRDRDLCAGPGRLAAALGLDRADDGADLTRGRVRIVEDGFVLAAPPAPSIRIGLGAGKGDDHAWRFRIAGDPHVSVPPR